MEGLEAKHAMYITQYIRQYYMKMLELAPGAIGGSLGIYDVLTMLGIPASIQDAARSAWAEYQAIESLSSDEYAGLEALEDMV